MRSDATARKGRHLAAVVAVVAVTVALRGAVNFAGPTLPKVNSAYYLLQVRSIVEEGRMMGKDTPLVFYAGAAMAKALGASRSQAPARNDAAVEASVGLLDTLLPVALALAAYALAWALRFAPVGRTAAVAYACISFPAVAMWSDFLKNVLGLAFVLAALAGVGVATVRGRAWGWLVACLSLLCCGATHMPAFGAGVIACMAVVLASTYRGRPIRAAAALVGVLLAFGVALALVPKLRVLVSPKALRTKALSRPFLFSGQVGLDEPASPPELAHLLIVWTTGLSAIVAARRAATGQAGEAEPFVVGACTASLLLACPLLGAAVAGRSFLMASTPLVVAVGYLAGRTQKASRYPVVAGAFAVTVALDLLSLPMLARPAVSPTAIPELRRLGRETPEARGSLIVARHGLEWWGAYHLRAGGAMQDFAVKPRDWQRFPRVYYLREKGPMPEGMRFRDARAPRGSVVIHNGPAFELAHAPHPPTGPPIPQPGDPGAR
jgi:hypothetical protein